MDLCLVGPRWRPSAPCARRATSGDEVSLLARREWRARSGGLGRFRANRLGTRCAGCAAARGLGGDIDGGETPTGNLCAAMERRRCVAIGDTDCAAARCWMGAPAYACGCAVALGEVWWSFRVRLLVGAQPAHGGDRLVAWLVASG